MKINSSDLSRICVALALCGLASGCPDSDHTLGTTNDLKDGAAGTGGDVDLADASSGTGGTVGSGGQAVSGGNPAGGAMVTGGAAPGGAMVTGGTIAAGGAIATGGTSTPLDANAFGQRYRISDNELSGWRQDLAPTAFAVYAGDELVTRMDGAADMYLARGCRVSMFQDLVGPDPETGTVIAMDFVTSVNANAMFTYQRSNGASLAIPGYGTSAAIGSTTLGGIVAYAHFNAVYFEVQLSGFADTTSATAAAGQFLNLLRSKVVGSAVLPTGWDQARIGNTGVAWWLNAIKGAYFFDVKITPSAQYDTVGRATVIAFAQKVVAGLTSGMPAPVSLVPAANAIPGWTLDQNSSLTASGPAVATDNASATALIDGAADPFYDSSKGYQAKGLAWEVYANGTYSTDLKIWQMASAADAAQLYTDLLIEPLYANVVWTTCSGTDPSNPCP